MSKVWFITGVGSGIGAGIAKAALKAGNRVVATARNLDKALNALLDVAGDNLALVQLDVTGYAQDAQPPGYMIANYTIDDQAGFQKYMEEAGPLAPKCGGKIIVFNLKRDRGGRQAEVGHGHRRVSERSRCPAVLQLAGIYSRSEVPHRFDRRLGRDHRRICSSQAVTAA